MLHDFVVNGNFFRQTGTNFGPKTSGTSVIFQKQKLKFVIYHVIEQDN